MSCLVCEGVATEGVAGGESERVEHALIVRECTSNENRSNGLAWGGRLVAPGAPNLEWVAWGDLALPGARVPGVGCLAGSLERKCLR